MLWHICNSQFEKKVYLDKLDNITMPASKPTNGLFAWFLYIYAQLKRSTAAVLVYNYKTCTEVVMFLKYQSQIIFLQLYFTTYVNWIVFSPSLAGMFNDNASCLLEDLGIRRKVVHGFEKFPSFDWVGSAGIRIQVLVK